MIGVPPVLVGGAQLIVADRAVLSMLVVTLVGAVGTAAAATAMEPPPSTKKATNAAVSRVSKVDRRVVIRKAPSNQTRTQRNQDPVEGVPIRNLDQHDRFSR